MFREGYGHLLLGTGRAEQYILLLLRSCWLLNATRIQFDQLRVHCTKV